MSRSPCPARVRPGRKRWLLAVWVGCAAAAGCRDRSFEARAQASARPRLVVKEIDLGREIDLAKRVTAPTDRFRANDIVFASVVTEGTYSSTLKARWLRDAQLLGETAQRIAPDGQAVSEFHVWKPGGWTRGEYEVQILIDDVPAGGRRFVVE
jgi:hypothetical protein